MNLMEAGDGTESGLPNVREAKGDGCGMRHGDGSPEIAFSSWVIEHEGDLAKQRPFAREVRRAGRKAWVQAPAFECPFEPHPLAIGQHGMPGRAGHPASKHPSPRAGIGGPNSAMMRDVLGHTRLLSRREMGELLPDWRITIRDGTTGGGGARQA